RAAGVDPSAGARAGRRCPPRRTARSDERPGGAGSRHHRAGLRIPRGLRRLLLRQLEGAVVPLEDRMTPGARGNAAVAALVLIALVTASWWALALWPIDGASDWIVRTREVCFGATRDGLPN